jgi:hypothetical protein
MKEFTLQDSFLFGLLNCGKKNMFFLVYKISKEIKE